MLEELVFHRGALGDYRAIAYRANIAHTRSRRRFDVAPYLLVPAVYTQGRSERRTGL